MPSAVLKPVVGTFIFFFYLFPPQISDILSFLTIRSEPRSPGLFRREEIWPPSKGSMQREQPKRNWRNYCKKTLKARKWKLQITSIYNYWLFFCRSPGMRERACRSLIVSGRAGCQERLATWGRRPLQTVSDKSHCRWTFRDSRAHNKARSVSPLTLWPSTPLSTDRLPSKHIPQAPRPQICSVPGRVCLCKEGFSRQPVPVWSLRFLGRLFSAWLLSVSFCLSFASIKSSSSAISL